MISSPRITAAGAPISERTQHPPRYVAIVEGDRPVPQYLIRFVAFACQDYHVTRSGGIQRLF